MRIAMMIVLGLIFLFGALQIICGLPDGDRKMTLRGFMFAISSSCMLVNILMFGLFQ